MALSDEEIIRQVLERVENTPPTEEEQEAIDRDNILSVETIRIVETIPGKTFMGLEIPNEKRK